LKIIEVVAAIVQCGNKTLCVRRGPSKYDYIAHKYEFPGGKMESGETREQAIIREMKEELHIDLGEVHFYMTVEHQYPDFAIIMHSFICPTDSQELVLTEHTEAKWLEISELKILDWAAADVPIVDRLIEIDIENN